MPGALKPLGAGFLPLISRAAREVGFELAPDAAARTVGWLDLVVTWNSKVDLTAARHTDELVDLMIADALVLARHQPPGCHVVDVGSGAGGPGLALFIFRPDLTVTLVEPLQKRVAFLRTVLGQLDIARRDPKATAGEAPRLRIVRDRGEQLVGRGESFDTAMSRATLPPAEWLALGSRLVGLGGSVWVLLAREPAPELEGWKITHEEAYRWPLTGVERRAVRYGRSA